MTSINQLSNWQSTIIEIALHSNEEVEPTDNRWYQISFSPNDNRPLTLTLGSDLGLPISQLQHFISNAPGDIAQYNSNVKQISSIKSCSITPCSDHQKDPRKFLISLVPLGEEGPFIEYYDLVEYNPLSKHE